MDSALRALFEGRIFCFVMRSDHREYLARITEDELLKALATIAARGLTYEAALLASALRLELTPAGKRTPTDDPPF